MSLSIALQLYTLRDLAGRDFPGMLRVAAEAGYAAVEFAGYGGIPARDLRALIDDLGLRAVSSHVPYRAFVEDAATAIDALTVLGCAHAVVPGLPPELRSSDAVPAVADAFARIGDACRHAELRFSYHNHDWELEPRAGGSFLDQLAAATDPDLVGFQLDVFWALVAGADPAAWMRAHAGRVPTLHAKELAAGSEQRDTTVGDGVIDWAALLPVAGAAGTDWLIVEQEDDQEHLARDIRRSLSNLTELVAAVS